MSFPFHMGFKGKTIFQVKAKYIFENHTHTELKLQG